MIEALQSLISSFKSIIAWLPFIGGAGLIGYFVLAMFAPTVIPLIAEWLRALSPLLRGMSEGIVTIVKTLWDGAKNALDSMTAVLFVVVVLAGGVLYGKLSAPSACNLTCNKCIDSLRADYKFVRRTPEEKKAYLRKTGKSSRWTFW